VASYTSLTAASVLPLLPAPEPRRTCEMEAIPTIYSSRTSAPAGWYLLIIKLCYYDWGRSASILLLSLIYAIMLTIETIAVTHKRFWYSALGPLRRPSYLRGESRSNLFGNASFPVHFKGTIAS
jgi:hypothetical protein